MNPFEPFGSSSQPAEPPPRPLPAGIMLPGNAVAAGGVPHSDQVSPPSQDLFGNLVGGLLGVGDEDDSDGDAVPPIPKAPGAASAPPVINETHLLSQLVKSSPSTNASSSLRGKGGVKKRAALSFEFATSQARDATASSLTTKTSGSLSQHVSTSTLSSMSSSSLPWGALGLGGAPAPQVQNARSILSGMSGNQNDDEGKRIDDMIRPLLSGMTGGRVSSGVGVGVGLGGVTQGDPSSVASNGQKVASAGQQLLLQKGLNLGVGNSGTLLAQSPSPSLAPPKKPSSMNGGGGNGSAPSSLDGFMEASSQAFAAAASLPSFVDPTKSGNDVGSIDVSGAAAADAATITPSPSQSPAATKKRKSVNTSKNDNSALDDQLIKFIMRLHTDAGSVPNSDGFLPIHLACLHFPSNAKLIGTMLCTNPDVARRRVAAKEAVARRRRSSMSNGGGVIEDEQGRLQKRSKFLNGRRGSLTMASGTGEGGADGERPYDGYYPLHVALANGAPLPVVRLLVRRAPDILVRKNASGAVPLSVAFRSGGKVDEDVMLFLLGAGPSAASVPDKRMNTPLHHACMSRKGGGKGTSGLSQSQGGGAPSITVLRALVEAAGHEGLLTRNFNGMTPLDLAQSSSGTRFGDEVISYLHEAAYGEDANKVEEPPV